MRASGVIKLVVAAVLVAAVVWAARAFDLASWFAPERIAMILDDAGPLGPLALIGIMAAAVVVSPIPSLPIDIAAGAAFGPWLGTLYAATGATIGAAISFGIARLLGRELIERVIGGHVSFCTECSDHMLTRVVLLSRLIPVLSFDLISYGTGLTKMSLRRFTLATFVGVLPLTFIYTYSGPFLVSGNGLAIAGGAVMVLAFLLLPRMIEKYDWFGMAGAFRHE